MKFQTSGQARQGQYRYDRPLTPGDYIGVILDAQERVSKAGNDMLVLSIGIDGPQGGVRVDHYVVSSNTNSVDEFVRALVPEKLDQWEASNMTELEVDPGSLLGLECDLRIKTEIWDGKDRPKVAELYALEVNP